MPRWTTGVKLLACANHGSARRSKHAGQRQQIQVKEKVTVNVIAIVIKRGAGRQGSVNMGKRFEKKMLVH